MEYESEERDGMRVDWDVPVEMDDGVVLRAAVYRPVEDGTYPVLLSYGPYGKGLPFQEGYPSSWNRMASDHPDVTAGSTNPYQQWEVVDPEKWVPDGYVCVRVDSRGAGRSPGYIDDFSPRATADLYRCIEWAGTQYQRVRWVILPLSLPALITVGVLAFREAWTEFDLVLALTSSPEARTLPYELFLTQEIAGFPNLPAQAAFALLTVLPLLLVYSYIERYVTQGILSGSSK